MSPSKSSFALASFSSSRTLSNISRYLALVSIVFAFLDEATMLSSSFINADEASEDGVRRSSFSKRGDLPEFSSSMVLSSSSSLLLLFLLNTGESPTNLPLNLLVVEDEDEDE